MRGLGHREDGHRRQHRRGRYRVLGSEQAENDAEHTEYRPGARRPAERGGDQIDQRQHLSDDLSTAALAAREGVSARHLTRLFGKHLGVTPGRHIRRARVEAAAQLLVHTTTPVAAIATRCGFGTAESLRQAFVRRFGVAPAHYRATLSRHSPSTSSEAVSRSRP
ncbi:helix-turn-helix domain-containing protein [Nocardia rhizosphaerihabitans]|uniref:HTH araC/xylS-type domain-containing protein n=1 Tax=Nocardia rhizosphaerihabitans TaxID=1691570 RepID=A0ABQ2KUI8_9NOCA|nr:helix-turn-helix domain-containing protein [Nocardia rhizosphaerihabitans]GGN91925.1 hypothetical protein GCM10011610_52720 [Nocardia rhizosphaerihabitans]